MTRSKRPWMAIFLSLGVIFTWSTTQADHEESGAAMIRTLENNTLQELTDRIDSLEKRLAALEGKESPILQADSRDEFQVDSSGHRPRAMQSNPQIQQENRTAPNPADDAMPQKTNRQTWSIRLLGHK